MSHGAERRHMTKEASPDMKHIAVKDGSDKLHAKSTEHAEPVRQPSYEKRATTGPFCETCAEQRGQKLIAHVYCHDCYQFQCVGCHHGNHGSSRKMKGHMIKQGQMMPNSLTDKFSRHLKYCGDHPEQMKDKFCHDHRMLVCPKCFVEQHDTCCEVVNL